MSTLTAEQFHTVRAARRVLADHGLTGEVTPNLHRVMCMNEDCDAEASEYVLRVDLKCGPFTVKRYYEL